MDVNLKHKNVLFQIQQVILDIKNQSLNNFNITAQCNKSMGYQGEARVQSCSEETENLV